MNTVEMRWLVRDGSPVLQYRCVQYSSGLCYESSTQLDDSWMDWTDVPVVLEDDCDD